MSDQLHAAAQPYRCDFQSEVRKYTVFDWSVEVTRFSVVCQSVQKIVDEIILVYFLSAIKGFLFFTLSSSPSAV